MYVALFALSYPLPVAMSAYTSCSIMCVLHVQVYACHAYREKISFWNRFSKLVMRTIGVNCINEKLIIFSYGELSFLLVKEHWPLLDWKPVDVSLPYIETVLVLPHHFCRWITLYNVHTPRISCELSVSNTWIAAMPSLSLCIFLY